MKMTEIKAKKRVTELLRELNIPAHVKGYDYLREAILLCIANPDLSHRITILYEIVAEGYDTTGTRVERAIRTAIEKSFRPVAYSKYFRQTMKKPTNAEFIATIADLVRLELEELQEAQKPERSAI